MFNLVGARVYVTWARSSMENGEVQEDLWHMYRVLAIDERMQAICIQGLGEGESKFSGGEMWVPLIHISGVEKR